MEAHAPSVRGAAAEPAAAAADVVRTAARGVGELVDDLVRRLATRDGQGVPAQRGGDRLRRADPPRGRCPPVTHAVICYNRMRHDCARACAFACVQQLCARFKNDCNSPKNHMCRRRHSAASAIA